MAEKKGMFVTFTGEHFQPVRLHYQVRDRKGLLRAFDKLRCVQRDPSKLRWVWLYDFEARGLPFPRPFDQIPPEQYPIVIGSWIPKGEDRVVLDLRSCERALQAIPFFDRHIPRRVAKVTEAEVVNRLFTNEETATTPDQIFDRQQTVARDAEGEVRAVAERAAQVPDMQERLRMVEELMDRLSGRPLPEVERMPVHYYEEGIDSFKLVLNLRQIVAVQHWLGNTGYTMKDAIRDISKMPPSGT